ncbi:MAG: hypothetical protein U9O06_09300 [Euryarchaeota archaeon]|nr:hypothetical protein [Euryarchaeota archaeon]
MKQAGVWSFRTQTGIARVVDGRLRTRHTLRGLTVGTYRRGNWKSILRYLAVGFGSFSLLGSAADLVGSIASGSATGAVSMLGVASLAALMGAVGTLCLPFINRPSAVVDIYDITDVTINADDCELAVQYDDDGDPETTTVTVADDEALGEAVSILQLKGAPVDEALVEKWSRV